MRSVLMALAATAALAAPGAALDTRGFVVHTDFFAASGTLGNFTFAPRGMTCVGNVSSDPRVRTFGSMVFVVNRFGADNLQVVDPQQNFATIRQISVGNGANPYDYLLLPSSGPLPPPSVEGFVTRWGRGDVLPIDWVSSNTGTPIAMAPFADADGNAEPDRMILVGRRVFVSLQRIRQDSMFEPSDTAYVAVFDADSRELVDCDPNRPGVQAIRLPRSNPATVFVYDRAGGGRLLIGCVGRYGLLDGGIAAIDPVHLTSSLVVSEAELGGDVLDLALVSSTQAYALVADANFYGSVKRWNPAAGTVGGTLLAAGHPLNDIDVSDRDELYVCSPGNLTPGILVYSTITDLALGASAPCALPPVEIAVERLSATLDVPGAAASSRLVFAAPAPNPARERARFAFSLTGGRSAELRVHDVAGRLVRAFAIADPETRTVTWDLTDASGTRVSPGVYLATLRQAGEAVTRRVLVGQ